MASPKMVLQRLPSAAVSITVLPIIAREYFQRETGKEYGLTLPKKILLLAKMIRNNLRIDSATNFLMHLLMAAKIMRVPRDVPGAVIECGCFKGGSTANLSLVAEACGRKLHVFDSFAGLPAPEGGDTGHLVMADLEIRTYEEGAYAGTFDEVQNNLQKFGALDVCELHKGYFEDSLPGFDEPAVFIYLDVDLTSSEETCLRHLWRLLQEGCFLFTDEAHHHAIAELFYNPVWWKEEVGGKAPGLVGAGNGLGLMLAPGGFRSSLGYTVKLADAEATLAHRPG